MELDDLYNDKRTPLEKRRVCPMREQYQACLDLYIEHNLSNCLGLKMTDSLPNALDNTGKKNGYHEMYDLTNAFQQIENDAFNEGSRKGGDPIPNQQMNALINSFTPNQWIYFDSEFNICFLEDLDTKTEPLNYFEHYYGDYNKDFIPAKIKDASKMYDVTFMDERGFLYWLNSEGREFYDSLPKVERARLYMDMTLMSNWGNFDNLGPIL